MSKARLNACLALLVCATGSLVFLDGCATSPNSTYSQGEEVAVKVTLRGSHELSVELDNIAGKPIELQAANLPWEWRYSIWVKAFENDALGSPLDERLTVADPPTTNERVSLLPGKPLQGNIDLRTRFPELEDVLRRRDVIIFWSYVPDVAKAHSRHRLSGSLTIPQF
jgi:hypothetical protein